MPTESLVCASGPRPDTMIMAESGTAPSSGRTMPPREKDYIHPLGFHTFLKILIQLSESGTQALNIQPHIFSR